MPKYSILIPTHNRPELFQRCIASVQRGMLGADYEIIVNNDSRDIEEVERYNIKYYYMRNDNLGMIYKFLFDRGNGEYVYYMEDDDIMDPNFYERIKLFNEDIMFGNYVPFEWNKSFIEYMRSRPQSSKEDFLETFDPHHFQLCQIMFRKSALADADFPTDNNLQNDFLLFERLQGSFRVVNNFFYKQTIDGGDNISFSYLNKDPRWTS